MSESFFKSIEVGDLPTIVKRGKINPRLVRRRGPGGDTPLCYAVHCHRRKIAEWLLKHGADINQPGDLGMTPLHFAIEGGDPEMVRFLLEQGADVNTVNDRGASTMHLAAAIWVYPDASEEREVFESIRSAGGIYDICAAASLGDIDRIRDILHEDPDAIEKVPADQLSTPESNNPLFFAVVLPSDDWSSEEKKCEILDLLLEHGIAIRPEEAALAVAFKPHSKKLQKYLKKKHLLK